MFPANLRFKQFGKYLYINYRSLSDISFAGSCDLQTKLKIESKWWDKTSDSQFKEDEGNKFYVLSMFPYPSGNLHMGHVRVYTISDVIARFHRMKGKNVLHPIGFDAFGLPAENAAIERKLDPNEWTYRNITTMKNQLMSLGITFDWNREVITCSEDYYKFTQYLFLLLYKAGLVYRKEAVVNWDPVDKTVLANEQIDISGKSWRSGAKVEKKVMKQWFIRTTKFASLLKNGLNNPELKDWRDIINLQNHWIGECVGANFDFDIHANGKQLDTISIWVKYPEYIEKAEFIGVSTTSLLSSKFKDHGEFNLEARNPFNNKILPVFITDELDYDEGCEIKLGFPLLSGSDKLFALRKNIAFNDSLLSEDFEKRLQVCRLAIHAGRGGHFVSSKLHDWLISRQRKWGTPIPVIHCNKCGIVPVKEEDLPISLKSSSITCHKCKNMAELETDTMDTFVDSSWYFLRYTDPYNHSEPFSRSKADELMPVDIYIGGKEHAVLHLYYARFMAYFLHSIKLLKEPEPFRRLLVQGMILGKTYYLEESKKYLRKEEIEINDGIVTEKRTGIKVKEIWDKMSKSKYNGVDPESVIKEHGVDTARLLILSQAAPTSPRQWDTSSFSGILNWQQRIWTLMNDFIKARNSVSSIYNEVDKENYLWDERNYYVRCTTFNYEIAHQFNVSISRLQALTNSLKKCNDIIMAKSLQFERGLSALIIMTYPLAPHFSCQLWEGFQSAPNRIDSLEKDISWALPVYKQKWPQLDNDYCLELFCKVNNVVKETVKLPYHRIITYTKTNALETALAQAKVIKFLKGRDIIDFKYEFVESHGASINIIIDHLQKEKIPT